MPRPQFQKVYSAVDGYIPPTADTTRSKYQPVNTIGPEQQKENLIKVFTMLNEPFYQKLAGTKELQATILTKLQNL